MMNQQFFVGVVENRKDDPLKLGRCQVRVFGVHSELLDDVPTSALPWAISLMPATSASLSGIGNSGIGYIEGTMVFLFFQDGESKQQPVILGSMPGIPISKDPFSTPVETLEETKLIEAKPQTATVLPTASGTLIDTSGQPVLDGTGQPVITEVNQDDIDISRMVARFGTNVTTVFNTLKDYGVKDNFAIVGILANIAKESGFSLIRESMTYSSVARLKAVFPSKFSSITDEEATVYVNDPEKLGNFVYANSDGNGSVYTGDGYKYRGGGFIQLTKKNNYSKIGSDIGVDLVSDPDKVNTPDIGSKAVAQYFINRFGGASRLSFSSLEEALTTITKKVNPGGFAADYPKVQEYAKLCIINKNTQQEQEVTKERTNPNNPENDVNTSATRDQINSGVVSRSTTVSGTGFKDPNGKYPLASMLKEQDSSRLSRRNTVDTAVDKRIKNRRTNIKAGTATFFEPAPAYNAQYPYNHVYATESGHVMEFDDTAGNERINVFHTSGTFTEVDKFGTQTNKIIGDSFSIVERNGYVYIDGTAKIVVGSHVKLVIGGNCDIDIDGDLNYNVGGSVTWKVGGSQTSGIGGNNSLRSGGSTDIDSSTINLNSGTSAPMAPSARTPHDMDYPIQEPENFIGATSISFDDGDENAVDSYHKEAIASGATTQKELDKGKEEAKTPMETDTTEPTATVEALPESCASFANKKEIPDTTQLSTYFSLGMLSTKAVVTHNAVVAQHGLSLPEIVCNLKKLAENCLDPIKVKYPNMFVTSAFRVGTGTSQHERGMAADMQFTGASKSDYYDIASWIKANVLVDQLLLEYKTTGTGNPWIHISYNSAGNRKQVLTFMNNKSVGSGLQKLQA